MGPSGTRKARCVTCGGRLRPGYSGEVGGLPLLALNAERIGNRFLSGRLQVRILVSALEYTVNTNILLVILAASVNVTLLVYTYQVDHMLGLFGLCTYALGCITSAVYNKAWNEWLRSLRPQNNE